LPSPSTTPDPRGTPPLNERNRSPSLDPVEQQIFRELSALRNSAHTTPRGWNFDEIPDEDSDTIRVATPARELYIPNQQQNNALQRRDLELSQANIVLVDVVARRTSLKLLLTYLSTLLLLLLLRKQMRLLLLPYNLGSSPILLAFIIMIYLLHYVTGRNSSATHTESSLKLLVRLNSTNAGRRAPLLSHISRLSTSKTLYP
jgi:hypothetical protein